MSGLIDRRSIFNFDWTFLILILLIMGCGLYSVHCAVAGSELEPQFVKQVYWCGIGIIVMFMVLLVDYKKWAQLAPMGYLLIMLLLGYMLIKSEQGTHVKRWLKIAFLPRIQPSEFLKVVLILSLASYFHKLQKFYLTLKDLIVPAALTFIPFSLVMIQPDLGTALSLLPIFVAIVLTAGYGLRDMLKWGLALMVPGIIAARSLLKPYQLKRLTTFINPQNDIQGAGWHTIMSIISVGSGGVFGKIGHETRLYQRGFLPEQHTDFIFSVWAEETGFVGAVFVVILFILLIYKGIRIAIDAKEPLGVYLAIGATAIIGFQAFYNMGMVMGMFPITGLPLPFFSYGGSHIVATFILIGMLLNIRMRRYVF